MKKPRLGTNDWGTHDRGGWDELASSTPGLLMMRGTPITEAAYHFRTAIGLSILSHRWDPRRTPRLDPSIGSIPLDRSLLVTIGTIRGVGI